MTAADVATDLDKLLVAFTVARQRMEVTARHAHGQAPLETCRFCGKRWRPWQNNRFDGHTRCAVGPEFMFLIRDFFRSHHGITYDAVARHLGVGVQAVRAWWRESTKREAA